MNPIHFRRDMEESIERSIEQNMVTDHILNGGDGKKLFGYNVGHIMSELTLDMRNPEGYWYFMYNHSAYGGIDKVGP